MPEIPEMEIYKDYLQNNVADKTIGDVKVHRPRSINVPEETLRDRLVHNSIQQVSRRAKYLIYELGGGLYLINHLMLDGRLYYFPQGTEEPGVVFPITLPGKPHVEVVFDDKSVLYFCDLRLGYLHLIDRGVLNGILDSVGIEPLGEEFNWQTFLHVIHGRRGMIKPFLMNQKAITGIGNAYSNEILFASGLLPDRTISTLAEEELQRLYPSITRVLRDALEKGGYIEEPFAPWDNFTGGAIPHFKVYDRANEPCRICGTLIVRKEIGGRNAFYCPVCQH